MDVVDRYLQSVRSYLPGKAQDDFVAELRENILAQVEDREEQLGRPLTDDERVAILRAHGQPLLVAGAYRSDGRRLVLGREVIGPALFPFYRLALIGAGAITTLVVAAGAIAAAAQGRAPFPVVRTAVLQLTMLAGIATVVFGVLDARFRKTAQTWDPRTLRATPRPPVGPVARRFQATSQIVGTLFFLWLWTGPLARAFAMGIHGMHMGPAWWILHSGITASTAVSLIAPVLVLVRPEWHRHRWLVSLFSSGVFIAFASASMWSGSWVVPPASIDVLDGADLARAVDRLNRGFALGLGIAVVVTGVVTVFEVVRGAWKEYRRGGTVQETSEPPSGARLR